MYQAITTYRIEIYLSGTKTHLADYVSRSPVDWEKEILITTNSWESHWEVKDGPPCQKCNLFQMEEIPHPEYCDKKLKNIPNTTKPNILQVVPSQPQTITCEGKTITYRVGGVRLGSPLRKEFAEIFSAIFLLPLAQEEKFLSKQPMYPLDSEQLVFLMNNLDKDFISRAECFFNKPLKSPTNMIAQVESLTFYYYPS